MCINKEKWHCCSCFSLSVATWIIGVFELVGCISAGINHQWVSFAVSLFKSSLFALTIVKPHSIGIRQWLFYIYMTLSVCFTIMFAIAIIAICFTDIAEDVFEQACLDSPTLYPGKYQKLHECVGYIHNIAIAAMVVLFLICVPLRFSLARVLKYAWKEQQQIHEEQVNR